MYKSNNYYFILYNIDITVDNFYIIRANIIINNLVLNYW